MKNTVYVKLNQITELTHKDVVLKDVARFTVMTEYNE